MAGDIHRFLLVGALFLSGSGGNLVAGDILRGGASVVSGRQAADSRANAGAAAAEVARAKAADRLSRATQVINAMRQMQVSARAAGGGSVPDGLATGGLERLPGGVWTGASAPVQAGNLVTIKQTAQQALLDWKTFHVGKETSLYFNQSSGGNDSGKWIAFNKVSDPSGQPSRILGAIKAEGQVYVLNQNGIIFGGGSQVNARTFVASSIPINENLVARGLLNQEAKNIQFLFSTSAQGSFLPPAAPAGGKYGDVIVERGAAISSPASLDGNGGRIMLVGANVISAGTLSAPSGQAIIAAGLQVGIDAHSTSDPSLRGLDVYVGDVGAYGGSATNLGLVESRQGSILMTGKEISQLGVVASTTSVSLNWRVDLRANFNAIANPAYDSSQPSTGNPFLFRSTGGIRLGQGSVTSILPEVDSAEKAARTSLALRSQINFQGRTIYLGPGSIVLAPNAKATLQAGEWGFVSSASSPTSTFLSSSGQVYLEAGSLLDVSGTTGNSAPMSQNLLTIQLRGAELSDSPLQRKGSIRGLSLTVDLRKKGTYGGSGWIGTPLGDVSGYAGLVERTVGQLSSAGGTVDITAGGSVVVQKDATIDVSGGWVRFEGGYVRTTKLMEHGRLVDIAGATPDRLYDGIYSGTLTISHAKWGVSKTFAAPLAPTGEYFQRSYIQGSDAGSLSITAPSMVLDGTLLGAAVVGPRQLRDSAATSALPGLSTLSLSFRAQENTAPQFLATYPSPPNIVFLHNPGQSQAPAFQTDASGNPADLPPERKATVFLAPDILSEKGFGSLSINNEDGEVRVPAGIKLSALPGGALSITAANIVLGGEISAPGGSLVFKALNISPYAAALIAASPAPQTPLPNPGRGIFVLQNGASLSTAGTFTDDSPTSQTSRPSPVSVSGGSISVSAWSADLAAGSVVDASGGAHLNANGIITCGNGGSISIKAGQDPDTTGVVGGRLSLGAELKGYSALRGGSLTLQAELVQIGAASARSDTLALGPEFFRSGGFSDFSVIGLGKSAGVIGEFLPGLTVLPGTLIEPLTVSWRGVRFPGGSREMAWVPVRAPVGIRAPAGISLAAAGVKDSFTGATAVRGDLVFGEGAVIRADPGAAVALKGNSVAVLGSIYSPGGTISITGGLDSKSLFGNDAEALVSVFIGSRSVISAAGTVVVKPDPYGRRIGSVLPGGTISVAGNLFLASGALLDVSGASGILDMDPAAVDVNATGKVAASSGLTSKPRSLQTVATRIDSNAGLISLKGGQLLYSDATLLGNAGGPAALGGTLVVSSGRFYGLGVTGTPTDSNLFVTQSKLPAIDQLPDSAAAVGKPLRAPGGDPMTGRGYFRADTFASGGFDSLALKGVVEFSGPVDLAARASLSIADGGVLYADSDVHLAAPYVALGTAFQTPTRTEDRIGPFGSGITGFTFPPTFGPGRLVVTAKLIDVGFLSLQNIGEATLAADSGDIRGDGTLDIAGRLTLRAGQIYPVTASDFTIVAYDYLSGGISQPGAINIVKSGVRKLPLSAGGSLGIYASAIDQGGALVAPLGTISLGWDGAGTPPKDLLAGSTAVFPVTASLRLASGSITSVSAVDPATGRGLLIPYGISSDGNSWIDPRGVNVTAGGLVSKGVTLSGTNVQTEAGSVIDLRGGGDLYAYRWVQGQGGTKDILASNASFAVIPGYEADYSPFAPFNDSTATTNLITGPGYRNDLLSKAGDKIYLGASASLAAGYYTLLPARYALLPGAVLVTPKPGAGRGTVETPDGASLVSGFRYNSLSSSRAPFQLATRFEVLSGPVVRSRSQYEDYFANSFLSSMAEKLNISLQRLPADSGSATIQATETMSLRGSLWSPSIAGGHGARLDISSQRDFVITSGGGSGGAGAIILDASVLNGFGVESLLVGGIRSSAASGTTVSVNTGTITLNNPGTALSGPEIILAANNGIALGAGSALQSNAPLTSSGDNLAINGNGVLVRVSGDAGATISRSGVTTSTTPLLTVGAGASISGAGVTLDSSSGTSLDPTARVLADAYSLDSGRISLQLRNPGDLLPTTGLVLAQAAIENFQSASSLSLLSYSSIDTYGSGRVGTPSLGHLTLSAGEIRGFHQAGGAVTVAAGDVLIDNRAGTSGPGSISGAAGSLAFQATTIRLGANQVLVDQFQNVTFAASRSFSGEGAGGLATQGDLTVTSPVITASAGANRSLAAAGAVNLLSPTSAAAPLAAGGLGGTYSIAGLAVNAGTTILLPSGLLSLRASGGDLTVSGLVDVSGTGRTFYDVTKYTDAGDVRLSSATGNVEISPAGKIDVSAQAGGGNAGKLGVSAANGRFADLGVIQGKAGAGGQGGSFDLDVLALPSLADLNASLTKAGMNEAQSFRVRTGNVAVDGAAQARSFSVSADLGSIAVSGTIDASGRTGGAISLAANGDVKLAPTAVLSVRGTTFNSAGKGGSINLSAGAESNGVVGDGHLIIGGGSGAGPVLDLRVDATAGLGQFGGTLSLRAPQNPSGSNLAVEPIHGDIRGASYVNIEGYRLYDLTGTGGALTTGLQQQIKTDGETFIGASGTNSATFAAMSSAILAGIPSLAPIVVFSPGAEVINRASAASMDAAGDLVLGTTFSDSSGDWDLGGFRFGAKRSAGNLSLRAAGDLVFYNTLSDGFQAVDSSQAANGFSSMWLAPVMNLNTSLPANLQSWNLNLASGADLASADISRVRSGDELTAFQASRGSLRLGKNIADPTVSDGTTAQTATLIGDPALSNFQVIRTGTGDIRIAAGRDVLLLNQFASIYTAGVGVGDPTLGGRFDVPRLFDLTGLGAEPVLGQQQQVYTAQYTMAGGNLLVNAQRDVSRLTQVSASKTALVANSTKELPTNWLYRRSHVDAASKSFGPALFGDVASTTWWVDFSNFFEGLGTLGGGDVGVVAGASINNVDAVAPTNARMTKGLASASELVELGGGDISLRAGENINGGVYYVERGKGTLSAGKDIATNSTRSISAGTTPLDPLTWLPTTLFAGKGNFDVSARGNILLGPVANPFLLPGGVGNGYYYKTYFSTYSPDAGVDVRSIGGSVTWRTSANLATVGAGGVPTSLLLAWYQRMLVLNTSPATASLRQPWLRLDEKVPATQSLDAFGSSAALQPATLEITAFSSDINLQGSIVLSPAAKGTLELLASGAVQGLQPNGRTALGGTSRTTWGSSAINISDSDPSSIPSIRSAVSYQGIIATDPSIPLADYSSQMQETGTLFLDPFNLLFAESGATAGNQLTIQKKQALHAAPTLHRSDTSPVRIYAGGDVSGLTLFSPKFARVISGSDISDIAFYIQNANSGSTSVVSSGRSIVPFNENSLLRSSAKGPGNALNSSSLSALPGDIQISGGGSLEVLAGGNLDLGTGSANSDGTGLGITSIGNARNPFLPFEGADLVVGAGIGISAGLAHSQVDFLSFIAAFIHPGLGRNSLAGPGIDFSGAATEEVARAALQVFYSILRDAGRDHTKNPGTAYAKGFAAISSLFPGPSNGDIFTRARDIRTKSGGNISIFAPGGGLTLANTAIGNTFTPPGIVTESGGDISIFTAQSVDIGIGRIFTLRGGNQIIWSSAGNIAAGSSSKTVQTAPPTRVLLDPQSADLETDLAGLATGGGIGVLATVKGVTPGDVDLIAPAGVVDAGDAGIRVTGNLNIAATAVLNGGNIAAGGTTSGVPVATTVAAPNIGGLTSASSSSAAASSAAQSLANQSQRQPEPENEPPSIIAVEVLGYGGGEEE